jgi:DME family drug/metabolite transporter
MSISLAFARSLAFAGPSKIIVAGLLWGTTGIVVQFLHGSTGLNPVSLGFYRLAVAGAVLVLVTPRGLVATVRAAPLASVAIGVGLGAYQALYFLAVTMSGVAVATVVSLGLAPVLLAGWESLRARRLPRRAAGCSVAAAIAGLALISGLGSPQRPMGIVVAVACGFAYAATTVLSGRVARRTTSIALTTASTLVGAIMLLPFALLGGGITFPVHALPVAMLVYLGVVATSLSYALFYAGLRTTPDSAATVLTLLEPVAAALLATFVLGEAMTLSLVAGGVLLLGAVLIAAMTSSR